MLIILEQPALILSVLGMKEFLGFCFLVPFYFVCVSSLCETPNLKCLLCLLFADETMVINVFCGVVSGVLSSSLANPTDVLKVRRELSFFLNLQVEPKRLEITR